MTVLLGIATRLRLARLLMITDLRASQGDLTGLVDATLDAGVDLVQLRDPAADTRALAEGFSQVRTVVMRHRALLGVYDALDVAQDAGADLLQLSERGTPASQARAHVHEFALIGRSCHSRREVDAALADPDVNYLMVGPVFGPMSFAGGLALVRQVAERAPREDPAAKPWFAVGGITSANLDSVLGAGAHRIAVSSAITQAADPAAAAATLKQALLQVSPPAMDTAALAPHPRPNPRPHPTPPA